MTGIDPHQLGFKGGAEPSRHPAAGEGHPFPQPGPGRVALGLQSYQPLGDAQQGARGLRPLPFGRQRQFLRRQIRPPGAHLLAGMCHLQLDHLPAHARIDRVNLQQPAGEAGSLLVGLARNRRGGCLLQYGAVIGKALHSLRSQAVPVLGLILVAIAPSSASTPGRWSGSAS